MPEVHGRPARLYVAGPMRGYKRFNFDAFEAAARALREAGYHVESPHELDLLHGFSPDGAVNVDADMRRTFIRRDVDHICDCDGIALLDGWKHSEGVRVEMAAAEFIGIPCEEVSVWLKWAKEAALAVESLAFKKPSASATGQGEPTTGTPLTTGHALPPYGAPSSACP